MRIGYPCINRSIGCCASKTFRLASYSRERLIAALGNNLDCLKKILLYNVKRKIGFFRISSDLVPFASHPVCRFNWSEFFAAEFQEIGRIIRDGNIRISMHPDQFTLLNSPRKDVIRRSIAELSYHASVLDAMELDGTAKIQIHVGGVYGDRKKAMRRFTSTYKKLPIPIKARLVIENDERCYPLRDCMLIHEATGIPVVLDTFHHKLLNNGESLVQALNLQQSTWNPECDGIPMLDYSTQEPGMRQGKHAEHIDLQDFREFIAESSACEFDVMLEIKDKEKSAVKAMKECEKFYGQKNDTLQPTRTGGKTRYP